MHIPPKRGRAMARVWGLATAFALASPAYHALAAPLKPLQEAVAYAYALRVSGSDFDAARVVKLLLARLKVPVLPNTYAGDAVGIYDFQVDIVAKAFREGKLTKLDAIADQYAVAGVSFGAAGTLADGTVGANQAPWTSRGPTQVASGFFLEKGMRDLRKAAGKASDDPDTFPILLMDALGRRDEHPMDLMKVHEAGCADNAEGQPLFPGVPGGPTVEGVSKEMLAAAREADGEQAGAKATPGDQEMADALMRILGQRSGAAGGTPAGTGGWRADIMAAIGPQVQAALDKSGVGLSVEALMGMAGQTRAQSRFPPLPADATPGQRRLHEAMKKQALDIELGADVDTLGRDGEDVAMYARDLDKETMDELGARAKALGPKLRYDNGKDVPADVASENIGGTLYGLWDAMDRAEDRYLAKDYAYSQVRDQQDEIRREKEEKKNLKMSIPLPNLTGSCLWLDAVQVLILQVSVFDLDKAALILPLEEGVLK